jgi:hypothetical protein
LGRHVSNSLGFTSSHGSKIAHGHHNPVPGPKPQSGRDWWNVQSLSVARFWAEPK